VIDRFKTEKNKRTGRKFVELPQTVSFFTSF